MQRFRFITILFFCALVPLAWAGKGGSGYSRYGIGDVRYSFSDISAGMGGTSIALLSPSSIGMLNPATLSGINRTRYSLAFKYEGYSTTDGTSSAYLSGTKFDGIMLAIPLYMASGIVLSTGITPYSNVNYNIKSSYSFGSLLYDAEYMGEGGISEGLIGCSWIPADDYSVGAKLSYYFGTLRHTVTQNFNNSDYSNAEEIRSMLVHGIGGTVGIVYSGLGRTLNLDSTRLFTLGLFLSSTTNLTAREDRYLTFTASSTQSSTRDTLTFGESTLKLPLRLGFGAAYRTREYAVASDVVYQQWSQLSGVGVIAGDFRNSYRFSIGAELFPKREATATAFQRWAYRFGFFYDATYYRIYGESIDEVGGSAGFGIPIIGDTRINFAAEYSFRGTTNLGLQKDNIVRLTFTLSGSERWFIPSEEE